MKNPLFSKANIMYCLASTAAFMETVLDILIIGIIIFVCYEPSSANVIAWESIFIFPFIATALFGLFLVYVAGLFFSDKFEKIPGSNQYKKELSGINTRFIFGIIFNILIFILFMLIFNDSMDSLVITAIVVTIIGHVLLAVIMWIQVAKLMELKKRCIS